MDFHKGSNSSASPPTVQRDTPPSLPRDQAQVSWLGLPRFNWSLTLLGLCVFTIAIVTARFPIGEVGVAIAAVGLLPARQGSPAAPGMALRGLRPLGARRVAE